MVDQPQRYYDLAEVADWLGTSAATVSRWRSRYPDTPPADIMLGRSPGWAAERRGQWIAWEAGRPGRGAGGGRPRKA